jgi:hypothetical protein
MTHIDPTIFTLVAIGNTLAQMVLGLLFTLVILPWLDRLDSPYVAIPKFWLMAAFSTTGTLFGAGLLWALTRGAPAASLLGEGGLLLYLSQLPFGVAGTLAFVVRQAHLSTVKKQVRDITHA